MSSSTDLKGAIGLGIGVYVVSRLVYWAYKIRMQAIEEYGLVIHEFDPYFNYRATEVS
jgi:dolichyl-diphosphooligosaccharide--protein glycosyltransferase